MDSYFTDEQTLTLLKLVHTSSIQDKFNSNKKKHRKVWEEISQILEHKGIKKSAVKCQNRYENTKGSYNTIKRNHIGTQLKPNYPYWDFWESILGGKLDTPFNGFDEFHETYLRLKESLSDNEAIPDWEHWTKYEEYYKIKEELTAERNHAKTDNLKSSSLTPIFTDRETDELLLLMGEPATRQIFVKHRKKHRIAWNYVLKGLKKKGIHKTADKVKNRFENLKRKYMHYKKNLTNTDDPPDWRYWNVFEEFMANRPNPTESDFMADDGDVSPDQLENEMAEAENVCEEMDETEMNEGTANRIEEHSVGDGPSVSIMEEIIHTPENPIDDRVNGRLCQICMQSEQLEMVSLFSPLNANIHINEALAICVGVEIFREQDSSIGNEICLDCMKQLQVSYNFRKLCWTSQYELRNNRDLGQLHDHNNGKAASSDFLHYAQNVHQLQNDFFHTTGSSQGFETFYEFVDTNPTPTPDDAVTEHAACEQTNSDQRNTKKANVHIEKLQNFKCPICMKKFTNIEYIRKHLIKTHSLISESQNFKNYLELSNCDSDDDLDENAKCYMCGKMYVKREYLKKHLKLIHNVTDADYNVYERIDEENKTKKPEVQDTPSEVTQTTYLVILFRLLCHNCGESFLLKHIFKKHIEHHERGSLLSCDYCDIKLVDKAALQRHMILHDGQRNHKCIFCAKGFFTRISQKRHERNVHTKEKSHICQYCDKKFVMWKFLERHLNTHTGEVVYQCDQCDKKYLNKNHLRVHKFRHAKEPPFKCSICSKAYFDRSTLKKHNYVHIGNPYQCTSCERTFDRRDKMNNHMRKIHGVEKLNIMNVGQSFYLVQLSV